MPKDRKGRLSSLRASPYPCSSRQAQSLPKSPLENRDDVKEWEEARCPICMEHPHNAVLLICSSHKKGCRPYMCDTSYRHSNCFDQFRKASSDLSTTSPQEVLLESSVTGSVDSEETDSDPHEEASSERNLGGPSEPSLSCKGRLEQKLLCPLCRGRVKGWTINGPAREFMNAKSRSCACETCDFNGKYDDLRRHARLKHPLARPSVVDPQRQHEWTNLERERDFGDVLSTFQSAVGAERDDNNMLSIPITSGIFSFMYFCISTDMMWPTSSRRRRRMRTTVTAQWTENLQEED